MASVKPPFTAATALQKVKAAQKLWNTKNPSSITQAYTPDSIWRNRDTFLKGHAQIESFLTAKFNREQGYRLRKELFAFTDNKIAVQFWYEYFEKGDDGVGGRWKRCYGLEDWTFDVDGKMRKRMMSGNEIVLEEGQRWFKEEVVDVDTVEIGEEHW